MPSKFQPLSLSVVNFSLTDGTNIPPPPDSPPPSRPATADAAAPNGHPKTPTGQKNGENGEDGAVQPPEDAAAPTDRPSTVANPPTPESPKRSSIRRLLSFNRLRARDPPNGSVRSPSALGTHDSSWRPGSPLSGADAAPPASPHSLTRKRSSGWFASNKRRSGVFAGRVDEGAALDDAPKVAPGPPPPTLPDWSVFKSLDGALESVHEMDGEDLFAGIGREA